MELQSQGNQLYSQPSLFGHLPIPWAAGITSDTYSSYKQGVCRALHTGIWGDAWRRPIISSVDMIHAKETMLAALKYLFPSVHKLDNLPRGSTPFKPSNIIQKHDSEQVFVLREHKEESLHAVYKGIIR